METGRTGKSAMPMSPFDDGDDSIGMLKFGPEKRVAVAAPPLIGTRCRMKA